MTVTPPRRSSRWLATIALAIAALLLLARSRAGAGGRAHRGLRRRHHDRRRRHAHRRRDDRLRLRTVPSARHPARHPDPPALRRHVRPRVPARRGAGASERGHARRYAVESVSGGITRIRVGDADIEITGRHTYELTYTVEDALNGFRDHDELYWNAIGTEWSAPIERATVTVRRARRADARWRASRGTRGRRFRVTRRSRAAPRARFAQSGLGPVSGVTVVVGLPKGAVPEPVPVLEERWSLGRAYEATPATLGGTALVGLAAVGGVMALVWRRGRDRRYRGSQVDQVMGQPDRRASGGADRGSRRVGARRVRAARRSSPRPDGHADRRASERARRLGDAGRSRGARIPVDPGDPEGRLVRQARLAADPARAFRRGPADVRAPPAERPVP